MYKTYDLLIAALLNYNDYQCSIIKDYNGLRCSFQFEGNKNEILDWVDKYWKGETSVEPKKFNNCIRTLKARTKDLNE